MPPSLTTLIVCRLVLADCAKSAQVVAIHQVKVPVFSAADGLVGDGPAWSGRSSTPPEPKSMSKFVEVVLIERGERIDDGQRPLAL